MHAHCATRTNRKWQTRGCNRGILKMHLGRAGWQGGKADFCCCQVCIHSAVVTAPVMHAAKYFTARSHRVFNMKVISNAIPHVRRLPPQPTHALSTPSLAWTHNPEGTYTGKLAMARGPKYDDRSHSHCTCNNQDTLSERVWMYVDSG